MAEGDIVGGLTGALQGGSLNANNMFDFVDSSAFTEGLFYIKVFLFLATFVFGCILLWKFYLQYKIKITIKTKVGNGGTEVMMTNAKIVTDEQNKRKLVLMKRVAGKTLTCPVPAATFKSKSGKKDHYELWLDDNFQLHPIATPETNGENNDLEARMLRIKPQEREAWARYEDKNLREKYQKKDLLEKYLPAGVMIIACVCAFLIFFFGFKTLQEGLGGLAGQFGQVAQNCLQR